MVQAFIQYFPFKVLVILWSGKLAAVLACEKPFPLSVVADYTQIIIEARSGKTNPHPRSPCWTCSVSYTFRSCRFESAEGSQAEDFPLTGEESLARLSLSLGVKAVTDPNAYTVVAAFQFLITA